MIFSIFHFMPFNLKSVSSYDILSNRYEVFPNIRFCILADDESKKVLLEWNNLISRLFFCMKSQKFEKKTTIKK